ncbi:MAG: DUF4097 family beta strand repeat protein [Candidatus Aminicenantes bacterium]|nr:DUF4097 family beta strand repeat protein [Candidatus Aminicenantes bacterium]
MKAKEIVLLIFIVTAGILFHHAYTGELDVYFDFEDNILIFTDEYVYEEFQELEPPFPSLLQITNSHGNIEIQGTDEEKISISFQKKIWRKNEEDAKEVSNELKMIIHKDAGKLTVKTNRDEFKRRNFKTSFRISLPTGMNIDVVNSYGTVNVSKVEKTDIRNRHGKIIASNIGKELFIKNSYKDVEIEDIQSDCQLESKHSTMFVNRVDGNVEITLPYGKIHVENINQDVQIKGYHSEIYGENLKGTVNVENSYRKISLFNVGPTKITGHHSFVEVEGARGYLDVKDNYNKVKVINIKGDLTINGKSLGIYGKTIIGEKINISSSYRDVELSEFSGKTTITLSHGDIVLEPLPLTHPIEVNGAYAGIKFYWPLRGRYPIEAKVKNGDISWKLPVELNSQEDNHFSTIKAFLEEKENPAIFLSTSYRTILIEE